MWWHVAHVDPEAPKPSEASTIDLSLSKKIRLAHSESGEMPPLEVQSFLRFKKLVDVLCQHHLKILQKISEARSPPLLPRASRSTNSHGWESQNTLAEGNRTAWQCSLLPSLFNIIPPIQHMVFRRIWTVGVLTSAYVAVLQATTCVISWSSWSLKTYRNVCDVLGLSNRIF